jgi:hypothetical protein
MREFKVGDKVECKDPKGIRYIVNGRIGEINKISPKGYICVKFPNTNFWFHSSRLIKPAKKEFLIYRRKNE